MKNSSPEIKTAVPIPSEFVKTNVVVAPQPDSGAGALSIAQIARATKFKLTAEEIATLRPIQAEYDRLGHELEIGSPDALRAARNTAHGEFIKNPTEGNAEVLEKAEKRSARAYSSQSALKEAQKHHLHAVAGPALQPVLARLADGAEKLHAEVVGEEKMRYLDLGLVYRPEALSERLEATVALFRAAAAAAASGQNVTSPRAALGALLES
jgi:hypothetical protein